MVALRPVHPHELEAIEIEEQHRIRASGRGSVGVYGLERALERTAVVETGQVVGLREAFETLAMREMLPRDVEDGGEGEKLADPDPLGVCLEAV